MYARQSVNASDFRHCVHAQTLPFHHAHFSRRILYHTGADAIRSTEAVAKPAKRQGSIRTSPPSPFRAPLQANCVGAILGKHVRPLFPKSSAQRHAPKDQQPANMTPRAIFPRPHCKPPSNFRADTIAPRTFLCSCVTLLPIQFPQKYISSAYISPLSNIRTTTNMQNKNNPTTGEIMTHHMLHFPLENIYMAVTSGINTENSE